MRSFNASKFKEFEARLRLQQDIILNNIRQHLHRFDDLDKLALTGHSEEIWHWLETDLPDNIYIVQMRHDVDELRNIAAALLRIKTDVYGICKHCSAPISLERLSVTPTAQYCLVCQKNLEQRHGMHNTSF